VFYLSGTVLSTILTIRKVLLCLDGNILGIIEHTATWRVRGIPDATGMNARVKEAACTMVGLNI
jgi:hypothetical protein